jgi:hypothetical protein
LKYRQCANRDALMVVPITAQKILRDGRAQTGAARAKPDFRLGEPKGKAGALRPPRRFVGSGCGKVQTFHCRRGGLFTWPRGARLRFRTAPKAELDSAADGEAEDLRAIRPLRSWRAEMVSPVGIVSVVFDFLRRDRKPLPVFTAPGKPDAAFVVGFGRVAVVLATAG